MILNEGIRAEVDIRAEKIGRKIRDAQLEKIPYMLIIGDNEVNSGNLVGVRHRKEGNKGTVDINEFVANLKSEISLRKVN